VYYNSKIVIISCSILRPELTALKEKGLLRFPIRYLNSYLHMNPDKLSNCMSMVIETERKIGNNILLIFGDCHPNIFDLTSKKDTVRVMGIHCGEIVLGHEQYKIFQKEKAFLLFPEWVKSWRKILTNLPGLHKELSIEFMRDMHAKFVYLETGIIPIPHDELKACSLYFNIPLQVFSISLDNLINVINDAINELQV